VQETSKDSWVIFGCSPFVNEIKDKIPAICEKYTTLCLNSFLGVCPTDYWLFVDTSIFTLNKNKHTKEKIIIHNHCKTELKTHYAGKQPFILEKWVIKPHYIFEESQKPEYTERKRLILKYSCVTSAINYAYLQGAKEIILIGVDLTYDWQHFWSDFKNYKPVAEIEEVKNIIYEFAKRVDIYNANPKANMELPLWIERDLNINCVKQ